MNEKPTTLEDLARAEANLLKQREKAVRSFAEAQRKLVTEMPEAFFNLSRQIRDGVRRFNDTAFKEAGPLSRPVKYEESIALTTKDRNLGSDFHLEVRRDPHWVFLVLRSMWRPNRPDAYIIEGRGSLGYDTNKPEPFSLRIDGLGDAEGNITYRSKVDYHSLDTPLEQLGERIVMTIVTGELSRLWIKPPWTAPHIA